MNMVKHQFHMNLQWDGGRNDVGTLQAERLNTSISIPPEMDGPGIGTNPDEMLLGASATCFIISLAAMCERSDVQAKLKCDSEATVDVTNGVFTYEAITHRLRITLAERTEKNEALVTKLAHKVESTCMISKALKGNVQINIKITFD